jgi:tRNA (pseudouridine54-N1)-methyltransferase
MRHFVYFSKSARTSGNFGEDLMKAGRMDIAIHTLIAAFFLSHDIRRDVKLHFVFAGAPDPPKHLEFFPVLDGKTGEDKVYLSKKDVAGIIKKMLYKYRPGMKKEVFPGYWIEKKGFLELTNELHDEGKQIFLLDKKGEDIRNADIKDNCVFILGDHEGLPKKELKRLKGIAKPVSVGNKMYFASHVVAIVNNELDRRGI